jgi:hypothetical protein
MTQAGNKTLLINRFPFNRAGELIDLEEDEEEGTLSLIENLENDVF